MWLILITVSLYLKFHFFKEGFFVQFIYIMFASFVLFYLAAPFFYKVFIIFEVTCLFLTVFN